MLDPSEFEFETNEEDDVASSVALSEAEDADMQWKRSETAADDAFCAVSDAGECVFVSQRRTRVGGVHFPGETVVGVLQGDDGIWFVCSRAHGGAYMAWRTLHNSVRQPDSRVTALAVVPSAPVIYRRVSPEIMNDERFERSTCDEFVAGDKIMRTARNAEDGSRVVEMVMLDSGDIINTVKLGDDARCAAGYSGFVISQDGTHRISRLTPRGEAQVIANGRITGPIAQSCGGDRLAFVIDHKHVALVGRNHEWFAELPDQSLYVERFYESENEVLLRSANGEAWVVTFNN